MVLSTQPPANQKYKCRSSDRWNECNRLQTFFRPTQQRTKCPSNQLLKRTSRHKPVIPLTVCKWLCCVKQATRQNAKVENQIKKKLKAKSWRSLVSLKQNTIVGYRELVFRQKEWKGSPTLAKWRLPLQLQKPSYSFASPSSNEIQQKRDEISRHLDNEHMASLARITLPKLRNLHMSNSTTEHCEMASRERNTLTLCDWKPPSTGFRLKVLHPVYSTFHKRVIISSNGSVTIHHWPYITHRDDNSTSPKMLRINAISRELRCRCCQARLAVLGSLTCLCTSTSTGSNCFNVACLKSQIRERCMSKLHWWMTTTRRDQKARDCSSLSGHQWNLPLRNEQRNFLCTIWILLVPLPQPRHKPVNCGRSESDKDSSMSRILKYAGAHPLPGRPIKCTQTQVENNNDNTKRTPNYFSTNFKMLCVQSQSSASKWSCQGPRTSSHLRANVKFSANHNTFRGPSTGLCRVR